MNAVAPGPALQTVLLVDDEPDILGSMRSFVEAALGATAITCSSGASGLEVLRAQPVDLVVSDYKMPGMDGLEFLRLSRDLQPDVPRILFTAFPDLDLAIRALNEGHILHFLVKPMDPEPMAEVLGAILAERKAKLVRTAALERSLRAMLSRKGAGDGRRAFKA